MLWFHLGDYILMFIFTDAVSYQNAYFGPGTGSILLEGVACMGDEGALLECPIIPQEEYNCTHLKDASVACSRT